MTPTVEIVLDVFVNVCVDRAKEVAWRKSFKEANDHKVGFTFCVCYVVLFCQYAMGATDEWMNNVGPMKESITC